MKARLPQRGMPAAMEVEKDSRSAMRDVTMARCGSRALMVRDDRHCP
jgi:hypothetical protein